MANTTFVGENIIDQIAAALDDSAAAEAAVLALQEAQPPLAAYLMQENFEVLTHSEREHMLFLATVIWRACDQVFAALPEVSAKTITEAEEANWILLSEAKGKNFRDRLDIFFADTPQEDLLAFVEDMLVSDEDQEITPMAREAFFISLKTVVDVLTTEPEAS